MIKSLIYLLILFLLIIPFTIEAQLAFSVWPEKFDLALSPGEKFQGQIRISNSADLPLTFKIKTMEFSGAGERGEMNFEEIDPEAYLFQASQWIHFEKNNIFLKGKEFKEINFTIEVPKEAEFGGHYAVAFFEADQSSSQERENVKIIPKIGSLFLLKIKGEGKYPSLEKQIEILEVKAPSFLEFGPLTVNFRLKNNDPFHLRAGGKIVIYDFFKRVKEVIEIKEQTILPQKIRVFELKSSQKNFWQKLFLGPYQAEIILSTKTWQEKIGNDRQLVKTFNFFALPWKIFLFLIFLIIAIIFLTKLIKKSIKKPRKK